MAANTVWIAVAVVLGIALVLFGSATAIEQLRSEYKRDLESFRSEIEHELGAHRLATATIETVESKRSIEINHDKNDDVESLGIDEALSTSGSKETIESTPTRGYPKVDVDDRYRLQGGRFQTSDILSTEGLMQDTFDRLSQAMFLAPVAFWNWIHDTLPSILQATYHWMQDQIPPKLQTMYMAIITSWDWVHETIRRQLQTVNMANITSLDWTQDNTFHHAINIVNKHSLELIASLELLVWLTAFWLLLYNLYRCCCGRSTDRNRVRGVTNKTHGVSILVEDRKDDEDSEESCAGDSLDMEDAMEDVVMERMFHESMVATGNSPTIPRTFAGANGTSNRHQPAESLPNAASRAPRNSNISKKKKLQLARVRAREYGARDKQRLIGGQSHVATPNAAVANRPSSRAASFSTSSMQSTSTSKKARLALARANAKVYAEQDKKRLQDANPRKKRHGKSQI